VLALPWGGKADRAAAVVLRINAYLQENDRRLQELEASGLWERLALASQQIVLAAWRGVEIELEDEDGTKLAAFTPHADALGDARFVLMSARHSDVEQWASLPR